MSPLEKKLVLISACYSEIAQVQILKAISGNERRGTMTASLDDWPFTWKFTQWNLHGLNGIHMETAAETGHGFDKES